MEFPFGQHSHHHHHHHQRRDDQEEDEQIERPPHYSQAPPQPPYYQENEFAPPPPGHRPSYYQENEFAPPPPGHRPLYYQEPDFPPQTQVTHLHHTSHEQGFNSVNYQQPPPSTAQVSHVSHSMGHHEYSEPTETSYHSFKPHLPSFLQHHSSSGSGSDLSAKHTVRVFCKADPNLSLSVRDNKVVLASSDPSDEFQHWYKDQKYSTKVKDEEGFPSFALVNKATGQAIKHSIGATHPVQLIPYNTDVLDESILWTESKDIGDSYRAVRMVNNIRLNVDGFHGDKEHGGVHDGTTIVLWEWTKGDNQRWKILPY